jgi:glycosyltransferase involved in cell wall biosynthesis
VNRLRQVGVLVPARNEEDLLGRCLAALAGAAHVLAEARPGLRLRVAVVLDGCTDASADVAARAPWPAPSPRPELLLTGPAGVGTARALGARHLLGRAADAGATPREVWLASTDADSTVPEQWLLAQVEAAEQGADARLGTAVLPRGGPGPSGGTARERLRARWAAQQRHVEGHDHVHGADLGVRGSAYLRVGGFPEVVTGEDVGLVRRLELSGARLLRTARHPVVTSDRLTGRAPDGVARDLAELAATAEPQAS